jgi:hypothetical protein
MRDGNDVEQRSASPAPPVAAGAHKTSLPSVALLLGGTVLLAAIVGFFVNQQRESDVPTVSMLTQQAATEAIQTLDPAAQQTVRNDSRECRNPMGFITVSTPGSSPRAIGSTPNRLQRQSPSRSRMAARIDGLKLAKAHFRLRHFMLCELLRTVRATVDRCAAPRPTKHPILISVNSIPFYRMSCYS